MLDRSQERGRPDAQLKETFLHATDVHGSTGKTGRPLLFAATGAVAVHLVMPVRVSHLHYLTNDEASESRAAEDRAGLAVELLREQRISVSGGAGSDDPLESMTDALGSFPATHVLLATSTEQDSYWLEHDLLAKARALTPLEVSQVVVPPNAPAQPDGAQQADQASSIDRS